MHLIQPRVQFSAMNMGSILAVISHYTEGGSLLSKGELRYISPCVIGLFSERQKNGQAPEMNTITETTR